jgi:hypothetical protein
MEISSIEYALLAVQHALLKAVTPELRAVVLDFPIDKNILYIRFYYHGHVSEKLIDLWQCAITEASAALGPDCFVEQGVERLDFPAKIPIRGSCAYLRQEETMMQMTPFATAMLAIQKALLGIVSPELRSVIADIDTQNKIFYVRFYYDSEVSKNQIELWQWAMRKASFDLDANYKLDGAVERLDYPETLPFRGRYVYWRKE